MLMGAKVSKTAIALGLTFSISSLAAVYAVAFGFYIFIGGLAPLALQQNGLSTNIRAAVANGDWGEVRRSIQGAFGLGHTYTIVGNASSDSLFELQRGTLVKRDKRIPLMSASKFVAATVINSAAHRTHVDGKPILTLETKVSEYFSWWTTDPADHRSHITLRDLLHFRSGLKRAGFVEHEGYKYLEQGAYESVSQWEQAVNKVYAASKESQAHWEEDENNPEKQMLHTFGAQKLSISRLLFKYGSQHLTVAGLMALKAYNFHARHEANTANSDLQVSEALKPHWNKDTGDASLKSWDDMMRDCLTIPGKIEDASDWHSSLHGGEMRFDDNKVARPFSSLFWDSKQRDKNTKDRTGYNAHFPYDLGASLGASPAQYAKFMHSLLRGDIVPKATLPVLLGGEGDTRSIAQAKRDDTNHNGNLRWGAHGLVAAPKAASFRELLKPKREPTQYMHGAWRVGHNSVHSLGFYGSLPWVDCSSDDPKEHHFGLIFAHAREKIFHDMCSMVGKALYNACLATIVLGALLIAIQLSSGEFATSKLRGY